MEKINSGLPREITKNKLKEFLERFKSWSMFAKVDQDWPTEYSVFVKFSLKNKGENMVKISIDEDSCVLIESDKILIQDFFLIELKKVFKKDSC